MPQEKQYLLRNTMYGTKLITAYNMVHHDEGGNVKQVEYCKAMTEEELLWQEFLIECRQERKMNDEKYSTVNDVIKQLEKVRDAGFGDYVVIVNQEYYFSKPEDEAEVFDGNKINFCDYYVY